MTHEPEQHGTPSRSRCGVKIFGVMLAGHGAFVALKLLGIVALVAALREVQVKFGSGIAVLALAHLAVVAVLVFVYRLRHRLRHPPPKPDVSAP